MKNQYFLCLIALILTGCIGAADFGMKEDVYQRTLASIENQSIPISINHVYWKGSPENIGEKKAVFSNQNPILVQVLKDTIGLSGVKLGEPLKVKASLNAFFPELLKELQAFAKYSEFSEDQVLSFAGSHFAIGGCSILARSGQTPLL
ncbi:hypothetical protein KKA14_08530, partial [bacterium]|nr:hypothetical protein [bacterium]